MGVQYTICHWAINRTDPQNSLSTTLDVPLQSSVSDSGSIVSKSSTSALFSTPQQIPSLELSDSDSVLSFLTSSSISRVPESLVKLEGGNPGWLFFFECYFIKILLRGYLCVGEGYSIRKGKGN